MHRAAGGCSCSSPARLADLSLDGKTPLDWAKENQSEQCIALLEAAAKASSSPLPATQAASISSSSSGAKVSTLCVSVSVSFHLATAKHDIAVTALRLTRIPRHGALFNF